jgi:glycolate oxidase iron-sulfur subunit
MKTSLMKDLEKCVLCGTCKALCPTYAEDCTEPMSARGRVMLAISLFRGEISPSKRLNEAVYSCLLCGMCESTCPAGVEVTDAIYRSRERLSRTDTKRRLLRASTSLLARRPMTGFRAARLLRPLIHPLLKGLPFEVDIGRRPLKRGLQVLKAEGKKKGRVALFSGCVVNYLMPPLGASLASVLLNLGYEVVLPAGEACCGAPLRALGLEEEARGLARKNMEVFSKLKADAVLSLCPTCTLTLKKHYPGLIDQGLDNAMDATEFLIDGLDVSSPLDGDLFYHDPCHLRYGLGVHSEPRKILESLGARVLEAEEPACCGFSVGLTHRGLSRKIGEKAKDQFKDARTVITACPGCMMQLRRLHPDVRHIIELIEEATVPAEE